MPLFLLPMMGVADAPVVHVVVAVAGLPFPVAGVAGVLPLVGVADWQHGCADGLHWSYRPWWGWQSVTLAMDQVPE